MGGISTRGMRMTTKSYLSVLQLFRGAARCMIHVPVAVLFSDPLCPSTNQKSFEQLWDGYSNPAPPWTAGYGGCSRRIKQVDVVASSTPKIPITTESKEVMGPPTYINSSQENVSPEAASPAPVPPADRSAKASPPTHPTPSPLRCRG